MTGFRFGRSAWIQAGVVFLCVIGIWQAVVAVFHLSSFFLPAPLEVLEGVVRDHTLLLRMAGVTGLEALLGLLFAVLFGFALGALFILFRSIRYFCLPVVILSQALPTLVIAPLFVLWFGLTLNAKVLLVIFALFFPISLSLYEGVRLMPEVWHDQAYLMRATRWQKFWRLEVRWAMPAWRSGIKMATAWAPVSAVASEWVGSSKGLGFLMINANSQLNTPLLFEAIVVLVAMAWILYGSVGWIVDRLMV